MGDQAKVSIRLETVRITKQYREYTFLVRDQTGEDGEEIRSTLYQYPSGRYEGPDVFPERGAPAFQRRLVAAGRAFDRSLERELLRFQRQLRAAVATHRLPEQLGRVLQPCRGDQNIIQHRAVSQHYVTDVGGNGTVDLLGFTTRGGVEVEISAELSPGVDGCMPFDAQRHGTRTYLRRFDEFFRHHTL